MRQILAMMLSILLIVSVLAACSGGNGTQAGGGGTSSGANSGMGSSDTGGETTTSSIAVQDGAVMQDVDGSQMPVVQSPHVDVTVINMGPLTLAEPIHLETDRVTVAVSAVERREIRRPGEDDATVAITIYFDVTNHTDRDLQRAEAADPIVWAGSSALQIALSMAEVGIADTDPQWYLIPAGETKSMVISRGFGEYDSPTSSLSLTMVAYGETVDTKQVADKISLS